MNKDKENNDNSLDEFLLDENEADVKNRLNEEKKENKDQTTDPWNHKKDNIDRKEKSKNKSAAKNYIILVIIIFSVIVFSIYNNNQVSTKSNKEKIENIEKNNLFLNEYTQLNSNDIKYKIENKKILGEYIDTKDLFEEIHFSNGTYYFKSKKETRYGEWKLVEDKICYIRENDKNINSCIYVYIKNNSNNDIYFVNSKKEYIFAKSNSITNDVKLSKDNNNKKTNSADIFLSTAELKKIMYSSKWSEINNDTLIITLTNDSSYLIKEIEFWFVSKKCDSSDTNFWSNKIVKNFKINLEPNQNIKIRKNNLKDLHWCYYLNKAQGVKY